MSAPARAFQLPFPAAESVPITGRRGRVTIFVNLKGGVGKTTTAVNLAGLLARGVTDPRTERPLLPPQRVLLIDFERLRHRVRVAGCACRGATGQLRRAVRAAGG